MIAKIFLLCMVMLAGAATANAQVIPQVSVQADFDVYGPGDTITVNGLVKVPHGGAVTIRVLSPTGNVVAVGQVMADDRNWSWSVPAEFKHAGTYTVLVNHSLTGSEDRYASTTFVYTKAVEGVVVVDGTDLMISYTGDPAMAAYTDAESSLIYIEFDGPSSGVMRLPDGLHGGNLVAVEGGSVTALPDGSYAYSTDSATLVMSADAVAVPEFGVAVSALGAALAAATVAVRLRMPH